MQEIMLAKYFRTMLSHKRLRLVAVFFSKTKPGAVRLKRGESMWFLPALLPDFQPDDIYAIICYNVLYSFL